MEKTRNSCEGQNSKVIPQISTPSCPEPWIVVGSVTMIALISLIKLDYVAKVKGFYSCNEGPR